MKITFDFEPIFKQEGMFTGMGVYIVNIAGKCAKVEIFGDGEVRFIGWMKSLPISEEEKEYFKRNCDSIRSK